jgi:hypothetical protein
MKRKDDGSDRQRSVANAPEDRTHFDWNPAAQPSLAVLEAVATVTDEGPTEMPPLTEAIDPDALDAILASVDGPTREHVRLSFRYNGVHVSFDSESGIEIRAATDASERPE